MSIWGTGGSAEHLAAKKAAHNMHFVNNCFFYARVVQQQLDKGKDLPCQDAGLSQRQGAVQCLGVYARA